MDIVDQILDLFARRGSAAYLGEPVSQQEHALQAARLAVLEGAPDSLVAAALLHDAGHLLSLEEVPPSAALTVAMRRRLTPGWLNTSARKSRNQ